MKEIVSQVEISREVIRSKGFLLKFLMILMFTILVTILLTRHFTLKKLDNTALEVRINETLGFYFNFVDEYNMSLYGQIDAKAAEQPGKYGELSELSHKLESLSNSLIVISLEMRDEIIEKSGGQSKENENLPNNPNQNVFSSGSPFLDDLLSEYSILSSDYLSFIQKEFPQLLENEEASEVINEFKNYCNEICKMKYQSEITSIEALNYLSLFQIKTREIENMCLNEMISKIKNTDIRFGEPMVYIVDSVNVFDYGQKGEIEFLISYSDTSINMDVYLTTKYPYYDSVIENGETQYKLRKDINYQKVLKDKDGKYTVNIPSNSFGTHRIGGLINYKSNRGDVWLPFEKTYYVIDEK